ncbi:MULTISPECIES: HugZ family protein [Poseidonibacter]|uniref:HugZ family pyridoxamine 5'-phosphate oxidase n=1 Tax=Poseidonibacter TaxID=2321187 RepID=UPI001C0A63B7|nr:MULTISPECIES: pyridoxamine 5'-phosphate oxidase family protein [Poseidonibacter]
MGRNIMAKNLNEFLENIQSLTISSLDEKGNPFSSYAPFVKYNHKYYTYLSLMAKHSTNLRENSTSSIFFCEDEKDCSNIFAKKRVSIQCETLMLEQDTKKEEEILNEFQAKFGDDMVNMLKNMGDFYLFEFTPFYGEAVFGFGKAYNLGGENFEEFVTRVSSTSSGHGHGSKK